MFREGEEITMMCNELPRTIRANTSNIENRASHRFLANLFRADAHRMFDRKNEDFSIPDLAGFSRRHYHADRFFHHIVREHDFHFHFRQKIHGVFATPINLGVAFLPAEPFHFRDGHPFDAKFGERLLDLFELERLDNRFQFFHVDVSSASPSVLQLKAERGTRPHSNAAERMQSRIFPQRETTPVIPSRGDGEGPRTSQRSTRATLSNPRIFASSLTSFGMTCLVNLPNSFDA